MTMKQSVPSGIPEQNTKLLRPLRLSRTACLGLMVVALVAFCHDSFAQVVGQEAQTPTGRLVLNSTPDSVDVFVKSEWMGKTPVEVSLTQGFHSFELVPSDTLYSRIYDSVYINPGRRQNLTVRIPLRHVSILFDELSPGLQLYLNERQFDHSGTLGLTLPHGAYTVYAKDLSSQREIQRRISLPPEKDYHVSVRLGYWSMKPVLLSMLVPGWGQLYDKAPVEAGAFFLSTVGAAIYYRSMTSNYNSSKSEYERTFTEYRLARTETQALALRGLTTLRYAELDDAKRKQNLAVAIVAGVYLANLLNTLLFHAKDDAIEVVGRDMKQPAGGSSASRMLGELGIHYRLIL